MGWLETDNRAISVQLDLTGTLTGTELGKSYFTRIGSLDCLTRTTSLNLFSSS